MKTDSEMLWAAWPCILSETDALAGSLKGGADVPDEYDPRSSGKTTFISNDQQVGNPTPPQKNSVKPTINKFL
jgi:hypothetical protein